MKELYILACGIVIGCSLVDFLERYERRIAWRAAELADEEMTRRARWRDATRPMTTDELHDTDEPPNAGAGATAA